MSIVFETLRLQFAEGAGSARWLRWLALGLWLACTSWPAQVWADASSTVDVERAVWADPTGHARFEEVLQQVFRPAPAVIARGYQVGATWLRVTVPPSTAETLWVTILPQYLDDLQVYSRPRGADGQWGAWTMRQEGDRFPFSARERRTLNYSLALDTSLTEPTEFYVRLSSTSTHALYVSVRTQSSALEFEGRTLLWLGLYLGVVLVLAWMSVLRYVISRDVLWALNVVLQMGTVVLTLFYLGLAAKYAMPNAPQGADAWMSSVLCGHFFLGLVYYAVFVKRFGAPRWAVLLYASATLAFPLQLIWIWNEQARQALSLNSNLILATSLLGSVVVWLLKIHDRRLRWIVRALFLTQTLYLMAFVLPLLGVGQMTFWHLYPALLINLFGSVMQHVVLARRDQLHLQAKQVLEREVEASQLLLRAKHEQLAASASFLGMLLHELKNPLSLIRLAVGNLLRPGGGLLLPEQVKRLSHIQTAVQGMDEILDRCRQVDRFESGGWVSRREESDAAALMAEWVAMHPQRHRVDVSGPESLPIRVDVQGLQIMFCNLLDNALGYSPGESRVDVQWQLSRPADSAVLQLTVRISNSVGKAGLPDPGRLFEKYYRAEGAHQRSGSGLGLYLVKSLVEREGGAVSYRFDAESEALHQIHFELSLPCD